MLAVVESPVRHNPALILALTPKNLLALRLLTSSLQQVQRQVEHPAVRVQECSKLQLPPLYLPQQPQHLLLLQLVSIPIGLDVLIQLLHSKLHPVWQPKLHSRLHRLTPQYQAVFIHLAYRPFKMTNCHLDRHYQPFKHLP